MSGLLLPVGPRRNSSWAAHQRRVPKSSEPGTDFYCPIGTPVLAPADGVIYGYGNTIGPATGRWVGIHFQSGMAFRAMHLSRIVKFSGPVHRGDILGYSGASGYGVEDWSSNPNTGGAHVHVTLWPTFVKRFGYDNQGRPFTIDFMDYADTGSPSGGGVSPPPAIEKKDDMKKFVRWNKTHYFVIGDASVYHLLNSSWIGYLNDHYGPVQEIDNGALTLELTINAIPWDAVDACMRGVAFGGDGREWSRLEAEGVAIRGAQTAQTKTLDDVLATAKRIEAS